MSHPFTSPKRADRRLTGRQELHIKVLGNAGVRGHDYAYFLTVGVFTPPTGKLLRGLFDRIWPLKPIRHWLWR